MASASSRGGCQSRRAVFISHASEDKAAVAGPLAKALRERGLDVWYDEFVLEVGDSLRESIDAGLARSEFGVVVLSPDFFRKKWTRRELNALVAKETASDRIAILPLWHGVGRREVAQFSLELADRKALRSWEGIDAIADRIVARVNRPSVALSAKLPLPPDSKGSGQATPRRSARRVEWHPAVHELWGDSRLMWILFRAHPVTSAQERTDGVQRALAELELSAYEYSETMGFYDGLLKAWIPSRTRAGEMARALERHLPGLEQIASFQVDSVIRHWVWTEPNGRELQLPAQSTLATRPNRSIIRRASLGSLDEREMKHLVDSGLLAETAQADALGFFIAVSYPAIRLLADQLERQLAQILDAAIEIFDPALYRGVGFADFVLVGRAAATDVLSIQAGLIDPIGELVSTFEGRTITHPITSSTRLYRDEPGHAS